MLWLKFKDLRIYLLDFNKFKLCLWIMYYWLGFISGLVLNKYFYVMAYLCESFKEYVAIWYLCVQAFVAWVLSAVLYILFQDMVNYFVVVLAWGYQCWGYWMGLFIFFFLNLRKIDWNKIQWPSYTFMCSPQAKNFFHLFNYDNKQITQRNDFLGFSSFLYIKNGNLNKILNILINNFRIYKNFL